MNPTESTSSAKPVFGPATAVLELAVSGRWRAPETTAALADHAAAQARVVSDVAAALTAEGWLIHGLAAVGRGAGAVPRAVAALEEAGRHGHGAAAARLRVGLASVARELGDEDSAWALLAPVLESDGADAELAADAHIEAVRCGGHGADGLLAAADVAVGHIRRLRGEQVELGLAALDSALANRHRVAGRGRAAAARASEGLRRLLGNPGAGTELDPISPHIAAWLNLELTLALLDDGQADAARRVAEPALAWAGRPAALVPLTRLRLVLAQRAYVPAGEYEVALAAVNWAAGVVGEQDLPGLEADCQGLLAEVHERRGALPDALSASRRAHQALRVHSTRVEQALVLLGRCAGNAAPRAVDPLDTSSMHAGSGPDRRITSDPVAGYRSGGLSPSDRLGGADRSRMPTSGPAGWTAPAAVHSGGPSPAVPRADAPRADAPRADAPRTDVPRPKASPESIPGGFMPGGQHSATLRIPTVPRLPSQPGPDTPAAAWPKTPWGEEPQTPSVPAASAGEGSADWSAERARPVEQWTPPPGRSEEWDTATSSGPPDPGHRDQDYLSPSSTADTFGYRAVSSHPDQSTSSDTASSPGGFGWSEPPAAGGFEWGETATPAWSESPAPPVWSESPAPPAWGATTTSSGWSDGWTSSTTPGWTDAPAAPSHPPGWSDDPPTLGWRDGHATSSHTPGWTQPTSYTDGSGWTDDVGSTAGLAPVASAGASASFDEFESGEYPPTSVDEDLAAAAEHLEPALTGADELLQVFEADEDRPLGLVALDVATPTGPLTGEQALPLLERLAEHVRAQLPPNSRLKVLARGVVLVVLPPVEPDVVARWMRSLAGGLSARWSEYAADVPRSTFRVAVGTLEPARSAEENVAELCGRLNGLPPRSARGGGSIAGGRHVASARSMTDRGGGQRAADADSRPSGRRRRPEKGTDLSGEATGSSTGVNGKPSGLKDIRSDRTGANGTARENGGTPGAGCPPSGDKGGIASGDKGGIASGDDGVSSSAVGGSARPNGTGPHASTGANGSRPRDLGINRGALARLAQLAVSPPTSASTSSRTSPSMSNGARGTGRHGRAGTPAGDGQDADGSSDADPAPGPDGITGADGIAQLNGFAAETVTVSSAATAATTALMLTKDGDRGAGAGSRSNAEKELSFAELLAGALAAYRDG